MRIYRIDIKMKLELNYHLYSKKFNTLVFVLELQSPIRRAFFLTFKDYIADQKCDFQEFIAWSMCRE
jgi:hypothetical protein